MKARIKELLEAARMMKFQPRRRSVKRPRGLNPKERNELVYFFDFNNTCYQTLRGPNVLLPRRIWQKIKPLESGCWEWTGTSGFHPKYRTHRYGQVRVWFPDKVGNARRRLTTAHRFVYELVNRVTVPKGEDIDHLCGNKLCVNPDHLEAVSHQENCRRRELRAKASLQETRVTQ